MRTMKLTLLSLFLLALSACANNNPHARSAQSSDYNDGGKVYGSIRYGYQHQKSSSNMKSSGSRIGIKSGNVK